MIAALFVRTNGVYFGLPDVEPWDEKRDARYYAGRWPIVAHPPCQRWGRMYFGQPHAISRGMPRQRLGDDDGCFRSALLNLDRVGGVLEHPRGSKAWAYFGFDEPPDTGGWVVVKRDTGGDWLSCCFEQGRYGHYARKPTWLLVRGVQRNRLMELHWGLSAWRPDPKIVARMGLKKAKKLGDVGSRGGGRDSAIRTSTPLQVRDFLISIARNV